MVGLVTDMESRTVSVLVSARLVMGINVTTGIDITGLAALNPNGYKPYGPEAKNTGAYGDTRKRGDPGPANQMKQ